MVNLIFFFFSYQFILIWNNCETVGMRYFNLCTKEKLYPFPPSNLQDFVYLICFSPSIDIKIIIILDLDFVVKFLKHEIMIFFFFLFLMESIKQASKKIVIVFDYHPISRINIFKNWNFFYFKISTWHEETYIHKPIPRPRILFNWIFYYFSSILYYTINSSMHFIFLNKIASTIV